MVKWRYVMNLKPKSDPHWLRPSLILSPFAVLRPTLENTCRLGYFFLLLSQKPCHRVHLFRIAESIIFPGINYQDVDICRHLTTIKQHKFIRFCKIITSPYCRPCIFSEETRVFSSLAAEIGLRGYNAL